MAVLEIIKHPNEVLETPCERVINFDKKLVKLLKDMHETMLIADGVGLARASSRCKLASSGC